MSVHNMKFVLVNDVTPRVTLSARHVRDRRHRAICMTLPAQGAIARSRVTPDGW
jgi:hypothetical protein